MLVMYYDLWVKSSLNCSVSMRDLCHKIIINTIMFLFWYPILRVVISVDIFPTLAYNHFIIVFKYNTISLLSWVYYPSVITIDIQTNASHALTWRPYTYCFRRIYYNIIIDWNKISNPAWIVGGELRSWVFDRMIIIYYKHMFR